MDFIFCPFCSERIGTNSYHSYLIDNDLCPESQKSIKEWRREKVIEKNIEQKRKEFIEKECKLWRRLNNIGIVLFFVLYFLVVSSQYDAYTYKVLNFIGIQNEIVMGFTLASTILMPFFVSLIGLHFRKKKAKSQAEQVIK